MLQAMREKMAGPVAWFVVGLISVPFAIWGIGDYFTGGGDPAIAKVGSEKITESQLRQADERRYEYLVSQLGPNFRPDMIDRDAFRGDTLEGLIQEQLLRQYAVDSGYRVSDGELREHIRKFPAFQQDGEFSTEAYDAALSRVGYTRDGYERQTRQQLEIDQLRSGVQESAFVTDADARIAWQLARQQRMLAFVRVEAARERNPGAVTDAQVAERYEQRRGSYMAPERIKLAYIDLDRNALPAPAEPAEAVLRAAYDAEKDSRFASPEERMARHILIEFGADKSAAKARAEALAAQLAGGADFAALAKDNSADTATKDAGGSLGWVRKGQYLPAFEEALFGLAAGTTSGPVETEFGWHIIRLDEVRAPHVRPFEDPEVRRQVLESFQARESEKRFQELGTQLTDTAFESSSSLDASAQATGLTVQETDWIPRDRPAGILLLEPVAEAAFSSEVLAGENSRPLQVGPSRVLVVRKLDYEPSRQRPLEEVAEAIRTQLADEAARAAAATQAQALLAEVRGGAALEAAAQARSLTVQSPGLTARDNTEIEPDVVKTLFRLPRPAAGASSTEFVALPNGDAAVVALLGVKDADLATAPAAEAAGERSQLRDALAGSEYTAYRGVIREELEVEMLRAPAPAAADAQP